MLLGLGLLLTVLALIELGAAAIGSARTAGVPIGRPVRVDLNRASAAELCALDGIGPARAAAIVLRRVRHGPFETVGQLAEVDGIGTETVARVARHLCTGSTEPRPDAKTTGR